MTLQQDDRVIDLADRNALIEASASPFRELGFDPGGRGVSDPVAQVMKNLKDPLLELVAGHGAEARGSRVGGKVVCHVCRQPIGVNFDQLDEFGGNHGLLQSGCSTQSAATPRL